MIGIRRTAWRSGWLPNSEMLTDPVVAMPKQTFARSGYDLSYYVSGSGSPLVLIHGFPLDHHMWRPQIGALSESHRVLAPDLRGFGESTLGESDGETGIAMADYAADVVATLDDAEVSEPAIFCGFSMGGYVLLSLLQNHPDRIRAVVLCDTKATADSAEAAAKRLEMAEGIGAAGVGSVAEAMLPKLLAADTHTQRTELVAEVDQMIRRSNPAAIAAAQRGMARRPDVREQLPSFDWSALVLVGAEDEISTPGEMREIAAAMPQAEFVEIPAAGHMTTLENPGAVSAAIGEFADGLR